MDEPAGASELSFVVIGYNEADTLEACLQSVRNADLHGISYELIYVDGGSKDGSIALAREAGVSYILGGEKRRRAAENRNLGLAHVRGRFVQFLDGDMVMEKQWPEAAINLLETHNEVAAVCGNLNESETGILFQVFQIDWAPREGYIRHCGGAAMYRTDLLRELGGFPEHVTYGEEPYLCWRIRNERHMRIYQINRTMAFHNLGFKGFADYLERNVRCGATYAEIAWKCRKSADRLWLKEAVMHLAWAGAIVAGGALLVLGPQPARLALAALALIVFLRKFVQTLRLGYTSAVAAAYALHTYLAKLPIAWGEIWWLSKKPTHKTRGEGP
jgi:glycosyltransferase involved in cell wall biosynthesis